MIVGTIAALAIIAVSILLMSTFDWNRAKPWLNTRVSEATGRSFVVHGNLSVTWHKGSSVETGWRGWIPWPRLDAQDVTLGNPDWSVKSDTMADIKGMTFSINPLSLLTKTLVIPVLYLDAPNLRLERAADGKNNWTFVPKDMSKWRLDLQDIVLDKGTVSLQDAIRKLALKADVDTLANDNNSDYGVSWKVNGTFNKTDVSGSGKAGAVLSLQNIAIPYSLQANVHIGKTTVVAEGTLTNPGKIAGLDMRLKLSGASLAHLYALTGIVLPETPPFTTEGHLSGSFEMHNSTWTYDKFRGTVGSSDVSGSLEYTSDRPRSLLKGAVVSNVLKLQDLAPLIGADSNASKANRGAPLIQPADKALPVQPFHTDRWASIDADVNFSAKNVLRKTQLPVENLQVKIQLQDSVLTLSPITMDVAGGNFNSNLIFDGHDKIIKAKMKIAARHLKLKELFPNFQPMQPSLGEVNGDAMLSATGNSVAALLGSSNGEIKLLMNQGTVSKLLLEEIGMNIGNVILVKVFGDKQVTLNCLAGDFTVADGLMRERVFVIDTEDALLNINGTIDLDHEQLNLVVKPGSKGLRILSLRSPIYLTGSFKEPRVSVDKGVMAMKAAGAIALAVAAPVAAILPLMNIGTKKHSECAALLASMSDKPVAPPPGKTYIGNPGKPTQKLNSADSP